MEEFYFSKKIFQLSILNYHIQYIDKMLVLKNFEFAGLIYLQVLKIGFSVIIYNFIRLKHFTHLF